MGSILDLGDLSTAQLLAPLFSSSQRTAVAIQRKHAGAQSPKAVAADSTSLCLPF